MKNSDKKNIYLIHIIQGKNSKVNMHFNNASILKLKDKINSVP